MMESLFPKTKVKMPLDIIIPRRSLSFLGYDRRERPKVIGLNGF